MESFGSSFLDSTVVELDSYEENNCSEEIISDDSHIHACNNDLCKNVYMYNIVSLRLLLNFYYNYCFFILYYSKFCPVMIVLFIYIIFEVDSPTANHDEILYPVEQDVESKISDEANDIQAPTTVTFDSLTFDFGEIGKILDKFCLNILNKIICLCILISKFIYFTMYTFYQFLF